MKRAHARGWLAILPPFPTLHFVVLTNTDGDGFLEAADQLHCWRTASTDERGARRFPDGVYEVRVRAWDVAGNRGEHTQGVRVRND